MNSDPFCIFVRNNLSQFWLDNENSPVSSATIWDAAKATLRGHLISYSSHQKKASEENRKNVEKQSPTPANLKALVTTKTKLNMDHTRHVQKLLLYTKQKYYEFGNKSSCLLAHQLKNRNNNRSINMIRTQNGNVTCDPVIVNSTFQDFYKSLYSACIGLGSNFINMIKSFYSDPIATVNTNGLLSDGFPVRRGCRQGCPLSPLLFILFIEPLAMAIRINPDISGVRIGEENHIISLFADDVLLYLNKPEKSILAVLKSIATFSALSGYKINLGKSVATPFNVPQDMSILSPKLSSSSSSAAAC